MSKSTIDINGRPTEMPSAGKLTDVLKGEGIDPQQARGVAVAVNERIVRKADWSDCHIEPGDTVEIVTARQGG